MQYRFFLLENLSCVLLKLSALILAMKSELYTQAPSWQPTKKLSGRIAILTRFSTRIFSMESTSASLEFSLLDLLQYTVFNLKKILIVYLTHFMFPQSEAWFIWNSIACSLKNGLKSSALSGCTHTDCFS